jgi:glycosyltransferase involved in cell wall biosynthesis
VNAEDLLDEAQAQLLWSRKMQQSVRFLFAGRLVTEKGVKVLLEAAAKLVTTGACGELLCNSIMRL